MLFSQPSIRTLLSKSVHVDLYHSLFDLLGTMNDKI